MRKFCSLNKTAQNDKKVHEIKEKKLPEFNQESSLNAKLVITTYVNNRSGFSKETGLAESELGNGFGLYDLGLNNAYFVLALKNRGLDSLIMGIRNEELL